MKRAAWVGLVLYVLTLGATGCGDSSHRSGGTAGAKLVAKAGKVELERAGAEKITVQLKQPVDIQPGDKVYAEADAVAIISDQGHIVQLGHKTKATVLQYKAPSRQKESDPSMVVHLVEGMADFMIPPNEKKLNGDRFRAESNSVIAAVRGTQFTMEIDGDRARVQVNEGVVALIPVGEDGFQSVVRGPMADDGSASPDVPGSVPNPKNTSTGNEPARSGDPATGSDAGDGGDGASATGDAGSDGPEGAPGSTAGSAGNPSGSTPGGAAPSDSGAVPGEIRLQAGEAAEVRPNGDDPASPGGSADAGTPIGTGSQAPFGGGRTLYYGSLSEKAISVNKARFFALKNLLEDPIMNF